MHNADLVVTGVVGDGDRVALYRLLCSIPEQDIVVFTDDKALVEVVREVCRHTNKSFHPLPIHTDYYIHPADKVILVRDMWDSPENDTCRKRLRRDAIDHTPVLI